MNIRTQQLHALGQSLWLDNINRKMLRSGHLAGLIADLSVTGLTSNPSIFELAIGHGHDYDDAIAKLSAEGESAQAQFFAIALDDLCMAADLFRPTFEATEGLDGWVSLEVSPLLADDSVRTQRAATWLHDMARRPNLYIKIPGTSAGLEATEASIFNGVPINITLLFSREHYLDAANAYMTGLERRLAAGLSLDVSSVASLFVSRWDVAVAKDEKLPEKLHNRLGIAVAMQAYQAYRVLLNSPRWLKLAQAGARPQRLLWASTGTKDPAAPDTLYVQALAARDTVNTMPEKTLTAFSDHGQAAAVLSIDGEDNNNAAEAVLAEFSRAGVDVQALAAQLQQEGTEAFAASWRMLMKRITEKSSHLVGMAS